jgi:hypothetical protein
MFVQRAGRAARSSVRTGLAVLLAELSAFSVDIQATLEALQKATMAKTGDARTAKGRPRRNKKVAVKKDIAISRGLKRGSMNPTYDSQPPLAKSQAPVDPNADDENLLVFVQTGICRRKVLTEVYKNDIPGEFSGSDTDPYVKQRLTDLVQEPTTACCDICTPTLLDRIRPRIHLKQTRRVKITRGVPDKTTQGHLFVWRRNIYRAHHQNATFSASGILPNSLVETLSAVGPALQQSERLLDEVTRGWLWKDRYFSELKTFVSSLYIPAFMPLPKSTRGIKRKAVDPPLPIEGRKEKRPHVTPLEVDADRRQLVPAITSSTDGSQPSASQTAVSVSSGTTISGPYADLIGGLGPSFARWITPEMISRATAQYEAQLAATHKK